MAETDIEKDMAFVDAVEASLGSLVPPDLYALARRGAEVQTVGHLDDGKTSVLRAAGLHQTSAKILEQAEEIRKLRAALREIADCKTYSDREYMIGIARAALGGSDE